MRSLPDASGGDAEFYKKKFLSRQGLLVSMSTAKDASVVDGSATLLRKDASWLTWYEDSYHHATGIALGFAWPDNAIIKCGYPADADSVHRELNGEPNRCGDIRALSASSIVVAILAVSMAVGMVLRFLGHRTEVASSVGALTAMSFTVLWWVTQWYFADGRFERSIQRSDPQACVDAVLARSKILYGCPRGQAHILMAVVVACVALAAGGSVSSVCGLGRTRTAVFCMTAVTASWAAMGAARGDSIFSPFGVRACAEENEFVINTGRDGVHIDNVKELYNFPRPSALVVFRTPEYAFDKDHFEAVRAMYDENATWVFTITLDRKGSAPQISRNVLLKDINQLFA